MNGAEKTARSVKDFNDIKQKIEEKYNKVMGKIAKYQQDIIDLYNNSVGRSVEWVNRKIQDLKDKINDLKEKAQKWLMKKLQEAQRWLDNVKKEIEDFLKDLLVSMIESLSNI